MCRNARAPAKFAPIQSSWRGICAFLTKVDASLSPREATRGDAKGPIMALAAELYLDSRSNDRRDVELDATIRDQFARPVDVTVTNLSRAGFAVEAGINLTVDEELGIGI